MIRTKEQLYFGLTVQIEQNAEEGTQGRAAGSSHGGKRLSVLHSSLPSSVGNILGKTIL